MSQSCYLSVLGFPSESIFVNKEIAVMYTEGRVIQVWVLKPPYFSQQLKPPFNRYIIFDCKADFGLSWDDGLVPYHNLNYLFELLSKKFQTWYVKVSLTFDRIFPFKSTSVSLEIVQKKVTDATKNKYYPVTCVYNHSHCAARCY